MKDYISDESSRQRQLTCDVNVCISNCEVANVPLVDEQIKNVVICERNVAATSLEWATTCFCSECNQLWSQETSAAAATDNILHST